METKIESRVGKIGSNQERVFTLISDFSNLQDMIPADQVKDFTSDTDTCSFTVDKIGRFGMHIIEREPNKLVKVASDPTVPFKFNLWIQLKDIAENETRVKVTLKADLNPLMKMAAKKPLTNFVEMLVSRLETIR